MKKRGTREQEDKGARTPRPRRVSVFTAGVGSAHASPPTLGRHLGLVVILLAAFVAIVPQLIRGNSCGHDFDVHLVSWLDCVNSWRHGILFPQWTPSPNYGAGEPRFLYYPPLTWVAGAAFGLVLPWHLVPILLTFLTLAGTGLATRALALEALADLPATLAGCASLFSGFALFTAYERTAFPEFTGGFWLPLILLFVLRDRNHSASLVRRAFDSSTVPLAIVLAGPWLSNLPLGVMAGYLLAAAALMAALLNRTWAPVLRGTFAIVLGLGLAACYWLPATFERNWVDIRQATHELGYNFENNWLFARHSNPELALHDAVLRQASWIVISMIAVAMAGLFICWRRGTLPATRGSRRWWIPLASIPVVVLLLQFPFSAPLWRLLPEMSFLQFPWRWLEAVEAPMAIFLIAAIWPRNRRARAWVVAGCFAAFAAMTILAGSYFFQECDAEDAVASMVARYGAGTGFEGMSEYEPPGGDDSMIATGLQDACLVSDPTVILGKPDSDDPEANPAWSPNQGSCQATFSWLNGNAADPEHRMIHAAVDRPGYLVLRLLRFKAWRIRVNGKLVTGSPERDDGLIAAPVPKGSDDVTLDWIATPDVLLGRWVSVLSVLLLTCAWFLELRYRHARLT